MPRATELLKTDHRTVEQLFQQFEQTRDFTIAQQICTELTVHAQLEEELVYPVLEQVDPELEQHAEEEHDEAKRLIAKIESAGRTTDEVAQWVTQLKQSVLHHVEEEEGKAFPKLESERGYQLDELGRRIEERKPQVQQMVEGTTPMETGGRLLDLTKDELYARAQEANIKGRSSMTKQELAEALSGGS